MFHMRSVWMLACVAQLSMPLLHAARAYFCSRRDVPRINTYRVAYARLGVMERHQWRDHRQGWRRLAYFG